jgi:hypothetical protein
MTIARQVNLDDWAKAKDLWLAFETGHHGWKIEGSIQNYGAWFATSLTSQTLRVFGLFVEEKLVGFSVCQEVSSFKFNELGQEVNCLETFIRALYIQPGTGRKNSLVLDDIMDQWGKLRGHIRRFGNCRLNFPTKGAATYGYQPKCIIMEKELG